MNVLRHILIFVACFVISTATIQSVVRHEEQYWPVILVPGDGGSQVEAQLNKTDVVHYICAKHTSDFFNIWLNMELLVPGVIDCWIDNMKLTYDNSTGTTHNTQGVNIRIPGFGDTFSVEWLDPSKASSGAYFSAVADMLSSVLGYERNISVRGAPYDFRKAPNENADFFVKFKTLVEETYVQNGNRRVILVAHSMGAPMMMYFLNRQSQAWKDKYVKCLITLGGVWAGSAKTLKVYAIGDDLGSRFLNGKVLRSEQITSPSLAWLMPSDLFWAAEEVLVQTEHRNYTVHDYKDFFTDLGYPEGWEMRKRTEKLTSDFTPPGVEIHCLHGIGVKTTDSLYYKPGTFPRGDPELVEGDGDGTVNLRSLAACLQWQKKQVQKIYHQTFPNVDHMTILSHPGVLSYIKQVASSV